MHKDLAADIAHVLAALLDEKAWFRHGVSEKRLAELTGLPLPPDVRALMRPELVPAVRLLAELEVLVGQAPEIAPVMCAVLETKFR